MTSRPEPEAFTWPNLRDPERVAAVVQTDLLDTPPEDTFDRLVTLAAALLDVPYAFMTLADDRRAFWKSCVGIPTGDYPERQIPLEESICRHVVESGKPLLIGDTRKDERTANHPEVLAGKVVAWAGYPIVNDDGYTLGTCHVVDTRTREWSREDEAVLGTFAGSVTSEIQQRVRRAQADDEKLPTGASEERFRAIAQVPTIMLWTTGTDGAANYLSQTWLRWRGTTLTEELGNGWANGIHPADRKRTLEAWATAQASRQPFGMEMRYQKADGSYAWILNVGHPRFSLDGEFLGYVGSSTDVDEGKRRKDQAEHALETLAAEREGLRQIFLQSPCIVWIVNGPEMIIELVNQLGYEAAGRGQALEGLPLRKALSEPHEQLLVGMFEEVYASGEPYHGPPQRVDIPRRDDSGMYEAWVEYVIQPIRDRNGFVTTMILYGFDVTEQLRARHASERLARQERQLQLLTASLSRAVTPEQVTQVLVEDGAWILGSAGAACSLSNELGRRTYDNGVVAATGALKSLARRDGHPMTTLPKPLSDVVVDREPLWISTSEQWAAHHPDPSRLPIVPRAAASIPLIWADTCLGALALVFDEERPFTDDERIMAVALAEQGAQALERARLYAAEHEVAEALQRSLLPASLPKIEGASLCARYRVSPEPGHVGGDWYEALTLENGLLAVSVGDVVGQGAQAAAVMGQLRSALHAFAMEVGGPADTLSCLNRFAAGVPGASVATALMCTLNPVTGELRYAAAGHLPPLVIPAEGEPYFLWEGRAPALGVSPWREPVEAVAVLNPGDTLLLYSDGLVERRGESIDAGFDRLAEIVSDLPRHSAAEMCDSTLTATFSDEPAHDDTVLLAVRLDGPATREREVAEGHGAARTVEPLTLAFPAEPAQLIGVRDTLRSWLRAIGASPDHAADIVMAVEEATANTVEHAYHGRAGGTVELRAEVTPGDGIDIAVRDWGRWRTEPATGNRGRGLPMMRALVDDIRVEHDEAGTTVTMTTTVHGQRSPH